MRARLALVILPAIAAAACQDKPPNITVLQLERGGTIDFVCLCEEEDGTYTGAVMGECDPDPDVGDADCQPYALVLQTNRGEIAVVDLLRQRLHDSDERTPFTTFPQVGDFPSDLAVTEDSTSVYVVHVGEPTLAIVDATTILGPTLPDPSFVDLPAPAGSIALTRDGTRAFVTLPSINSLAMVDLEADPPTVESFVVGPEPVPVEEEPEPVEDADTDPDLDGDASDDVIEEDAIEDLPSDVPEEDAPPELPAAFMPIEVKVIEQADPARILVSGFDMDGGGGVLELDLGSITAGGEPSDALTAVHLEGVPIGPFDVLLVEPDAGHVDGDPETGDPPQGLFLYAANRDEQLLHVVDLTTGEEQDTTGGNPLVSRGAIRTDGLVTDVLAVHLEQEDLPEPGDVLDALEFNGDFVFVVTSIGVVEAIDVYDRRCWELLSNDDPYDDPPSCPEHVLRNSYDEDESYPRWSDPPSLFNDADELLPYDDIRCPSPDYNTPCFVDADDALPDSLDSERTYGITFFPDVPGSNDVLADLRRPKSEVWFITWEGKIPWTTGIGGNLSEDGSTLTDEGMPFCAFGVRSGDVLVVDDGPDPIDTTVDCSAYPDDGGMAYRIVEAYELQLVIEPLDQWNLDDGAAEPWLEGGYDLPVEDCFPFAVMYHVRTLDLWTVSGSDTGFLHSTMIDEDGFCVDELPACTSWDEEDCTLLTGRATAGEVFVNPYIRFEIDNTDVTFPPENPNSIMRPGLGFQLMAQSGFQQLGVRAATLPDSIEWFEHYGTFIISDRAWDGVLEFDPDTFRVVFEYN